MFSCFPFRSCRSDEQSVDKSHCSLHSVPKEVFKSSETIEECVLDSNQITELPKKLFLLPNLRRLALSDNLITKVPDGIGNLVKLQDLDISRNDISEISENIKFCAELVSIDLCSNPLRGLPNGLFQLKTLVNLNLNDTGLAELPSGIGNLANLRRLELRDNILEQLPSTLGNLQRLEMLDLGSNEFDKLPVAICSLLSLQELFFDCNHLEELPDNFGNLRKLQQLDASDNQLKKLPENLGSLSNLTDLSLKSNCIEQLPASIGQLNRLNILRLEQNCLDSMPSEIGGLVELSDVYLAENRLESLPAAIESWKKLIHCNLDRNRIAQLPKQLCSLHNLHILSIRDNRLTSLPADIGLLKDLRVLDLVGNQLKALPASLASCRLTALWLSEQQTRPLMTLQTVDSQASGTDLTCYLLPQPQAPDPDCESANNAPSNSVLPAADTIASELISPQQQQQHLHHLDSQASSASAASASGGGACAVAKQRGVLKYAKRLVDGPVIPHAPGGHAKELTFSPRRVSPAPSDPEITVGIGRQNRLARESSVPVGISQSVLRSPAVSTTVQASVWHQQQLQQPPQTHHPHPHQSHHSVPLIRFNSMDKERSSTIGQEDIGADHAAGSVALRHVGFAGELEDNEAKSSGWKRRDTPHYNKNAKISRSQQDSAYAAQLLQKYGGGKRPASESGAASGAGGFDSDGATLATVTKQRLIVVLERQAGAQLGLSIAGGVGSLPWLPDDNGIFLSKVVEGLPAFAAGLRPGDRLLSVCGVSLATASHAEAVEAMKSAGQRLELEVERRRAMSEAAPGVGEPCEDEDQDEDEEIETDGERTEEDKQDESPQLPRRKGSLERLHDATRASCVNKTSHNEDEENGGVEGEHGDAEEALWISQQPQKLTTAKLVEPEIAIAQAITRNSESPAHADSVPAAVSANAAPPAEEQAEDAEDDDSSVPLGPDEARIELHPDSAGRLGLSICGSCDRPAHPFGVGLYVSRLTAGMPAEAAGLRVGDRLLSANGRSLAKATHREAIAAMRSSSNPATVVRLRVRHEAPPAGLRCLRIPLTTAAAGTPPNSGQKTARLRLGVAVCGGAGSPRANLDDPTDEGIFVARVSPGGLFHADGQLKPGMRLLDANGRNLIGVSREEAVSVLRSLISPAVSGTAAASVSEIQLTVCDGCPPERLLLVDVEHDSTRPLSATGDGPRRESSTSIDPGEEIEHLRELRLVCQPNQAPVDCQQQRRSLMPAIPQAPGD